MGFGDRRAATAMQSRQGLSPRNFRQLCLDWTADSGDLATGENRAGRWKKQVRTTSVPVFKCQGVQVRYPVAVRGGVTLLAWAPR